MDRRRPPLRASDLARLSGVSTSTISTMMAGQIGQLPRKSTMVAICDTLGLPVPLFVGAALDTLNVPRPPSAEYTDPLIAEIRASALPEPTKEFLEGRVRTKLRQLADDVREDIEREQIIRKA